MELKDRLSELRLEKGLTMDMLVYDMNAKYSINLNKGLVSKWENGVNEPSLRYASYLAQYYDVSLDYLIGLTDVRTPARLLAYAKKVKELYQSTEASVLAASDIPKAFAAHRVTKKSEKIIKARNKEA